jgi:hypothetical protein
MALAISTLTADLLLSRDAMQHKSPEEREEMVKSLAALDGTESDTQPESDHAQPSKRKRTKAVLLGRFLAIVVLVSSEVWMVGFVVHGGFIFFPLVAIPVLAIALLSTTRSPK